MTVVADTSVWVEFLRATGGPAHRALKRLIESRAKLAITEIVLMELLAGAGSADDAALLRSRLHALPVLRLGGLDAFEDAATIYRRCRSAGETIRSLADCLIAVAVLRADAELLHADADFDVIARHTSLRVRRPR